MKSSVTEIQSTTIVKATFITGYRKYLSCYYELIPPFVFSFNHIVKYPNFCYKHFLFFSNSAIYPESNKYNLNHTALSPAEGGSTGSTDLHIK